MGDYSDEERLSRQEAAERLTDIAYGLTSGGPIEMRIGGHSVKLPVGDDLVLKRADRQQERSPHLRSAHHTWRALELAQRPRSEPFISALHQSSWRARISR